MPEETKTKKGQEEARVAQSRSEASAEPTEKASDRWQRSDRETVKAVEKAVTSVGRAD